MPICKRKICSAKRIDHQRMCFRGMCLSLTKDALLSYYHFNWIIAHLGIIRARFGAIHHILSTALPVSMKIFDLKRMVAHSSERMFDLISDVERYPEFLPGWQTARVLTREGDIYHVDQELGWGEFRIRFRSRVIYTRPTRIDVSSIGDPFRQLSIRWVFEPVDHTGCLIKLRIGFALRSTVLIHLMKPIITSRFSDIIPAFEDRAYLVYPEHQEIFECSNHPDAACFH